MKFARFLKRGGFIAAVLLVLALGVVFGLALLGQLVYGMYGLGGMVYGGIWVTALVFRAFDIGCKE